MKNKYSKCVSVDNHAFVIEFEQISQSSYKMAILDGNKIVEVIKCDGINIDETETVLLRSAAQYLQSHSLNPEVKEKLLGLGYAEEGHIIPINDGLQNTYTLNPLQAYTAEQCLHDACQACHGTGINKSTGGICVHNISCSCPKCSVR